MSFAIFDQVLSPMLDKCEALLETPSQKSKEWTNDFVGQITLVARMKGI